MAQIQVSMAWSSRFDATPAEVKYFWSWFIFGSIMDAATRRRLWRSWGFCPRHTWLHAVVECEIWGGKPFGTSILYEDLVEKALNASRNKFFYLRSLAKRFDSRLSCLVCEYLTVCVNEEAGEWYAEKAVKVNRRSRISELIVNLHEFWRVNACTLCKAGSGMTCRPHLRQCNQVSTEVVSDYLQDLQQRLKLLVRSMTWRGPSVEGGVQSAWIEALGWFAGWDFPVSVVNNG